MVHMSYVPTAGGSPESHRTNQSDDAVEIGSEVGYSRPSCRGGVFALGSPPRTRKRVPKQLRRRSDERGAEMVEFAFVVVLLIALLYGIISYGLILAAQTTITQAAADGARAGIVESSSVGSIGPPCTTTACTVSQTQAGDDLGWLGKGTCGTTATASNPITCVSTEVPCPSNANNECLTVTVDYDYSSNPLFPELPGMGVITPSTISSSDTLQMSTPSS
jgi:Flp pilus assembly protein TadG